MKGSINFRQSVMVLLVAIPATYACSCLTRSLDYFWCINSTAVIKGRILSEAHIDVSGKTTFNLNASVRKRYRVREENVYKNGSATITKVNTNFFEMYVSSSESMCGVSFNRTHYLLVGSVDDQGQFFTNMCFPSKPWVNVTADTNTMTLLNGERSANCSSIYIF